MKLTRTCWSFRQSTRSRSARCTRRCWHRLGRSRPRHGETSSSSHRTRAVTVTELIFVCALLMLSWVFPGEGFDVKEDEGPVSQRDPQDRLSRMWEQQVDFMRLLQQERNFPEFPTDQIG